jgi:PAS domain-containing protein
MSGDPIYIQHADLNVSQDEAEKNEGLHMMAIFPVRHKDRICACLNVASHTLDEISIPEQDVLGAIAGQIGQVITRIESEQFLRASEEKYKSLFENMQAAFALHEMVFDEAGRPIDYIFLDINEAFERQTRLKRENIIGRTVTELFPGIENDPVDWIGTYGNVVLTGSSRVSLVNRTDRTEARHCHDIYG